MGYKRAGFEVVGNVEIDPKINRMYVKNHKPKYNFCMDLRDFNKTDIPDDLMEIDILDGSPPCTVFSTAGKREKDWGRKKKFREGQADQTLDDLFFVFLDTVAKLKPKIVIAENVVGMNVGRAKGFINLIAKRFKNLGYNLQLFQLNAATMDVPQARNRLFFIANRMGYAKLRLSFDSSPITFGEVRSKNGRDWFNGKQLKTLLDQALPGEYDLGAVAKRIAGVENKYFTQMIIPDDRVAPTVASAGYYMRFSDRMACSDEDFVNLQTFPQDYDFDGNEVQYVCGMSVPPNMMANIATEIYEQWLS